MRSAIVLGLALLVASTAVGAAEARVASDQKRGELPTPAILFEPNNPIPPRIEVVAQPPDQVKIDIDMNCRRGDRDRRSSRTIRTMPPFSRRFGLPVANPDKCTIFVLATYADESEQPNGYMKHGTMKLRIYHWREPCRSTICRYEWRSHRCDCCRTADTRPCRVALRNPLL